MLQLKNVTKKYARGNREFTAVREIQLNLHAGQIIAILGKSGSGKSTLLNMAGGLLTPTKGSVLLDGQELYQQNDAVLSRLRCEKIGIIPQGESLLNNLTVLQNVMLPYSLYKNRGEIKKRAKELLDKVGLLEFADVRPNTLSGGEMRRVAIARALIMEPKVILADEPTSNLDCENTQKVIQLLKQAANHDTAVLIVTHEEETVQDVSEIYRMEKGSLTRDYEGGNKDGRAGIPFNLRTCGEYTTTATDQL